MRELDRHCSCLDHFAAAVSAAAVSAVAVAVAAASAAATLHVARSGQL